MRLRTAPEAYRFQVASGVFFFSLYRLHCNGSFAVSARREIRSLAWRGLLSAFVLGGATAAAGQGTQANPAGGELDRQFQAAVALYDAGKFAEAAAMLEKLEPRVPNDFQVQELMGLVYGSEAESDKAVEHLQRAVHLQPNSAAARTNLAASLAHAGKSDAAIEQLRVAIRLEPKDYDANHNLGELYIQTGKVAEATSLLEAAERANPKSYGNGYDLALALFETGQLKKARQVIADLLTMRDTGELHELLGRVEEKEGNFLAAEHEFESAAKLDPSEDNLFSWGGELLLHRAYDAAIEVFERASERYAKSPRSWIGLGMALDLEGRHDDAFKALITAADLDPADARTYLFLSKAYANSANHAEEVIERFRRYAALKPEDAMAQYYYAMSMWKGKPLEDAGVDFHTVEALLLKAVALDGKLVDAHVQLGNLYADQHEYAKSISEYQRALALDANLPDVHYRLGQGYGHVGEKQKAAAEIEIYQKQRAEHLAEADKEKAEVQQFVVTTKDRPSAKQ